MRYNAILALALTLVGCAENNMHTTSKHPVQKTNMNADADRSDSKFMQEFVNYQSPFQRCLAKNAGDDRREMICMMYNNPPQRTWTAEDLCRPSDIQCILIARSKQQ